MLALAVSVAALDTPGRSQQIADGAAADPAGGDHAVVGLAIDDALGVSTHGDLLQRGLGGRAGGGVEFGRVEIRQPDLHPVGWPLAHGHTQGVVVTDIDEPAGRAVVAEIGDAARFLAQDVADEARWAEDPLSHPVLKAMNARELADIPFPRMRAEQRSARRS